MKRIQKVTSIPLLAALLFAGGATAGYVGMAYAQDAGTTDADTTQSPADPSKGRHVGKNGVKEELLTGETAAKVAAAAQAAQPEATIERVETDAEGATYEAHMTTSDGSRITLKFDENFKVTGTDNGPRRR